MDIRHLTTTMQPDQHWELVDHPQPGAPASEALASSSIAPAAAAEKMTPAQLNYNIAHIKADLADQEWENAELLCRRCLSLVKGNRELESKLNDLLADALLGKGGVEAARFAREMSSMLDDKSWNAARDDFRALMQKGEWGKAVELCNKWIVKADRYLLVTVYLMQADALLKLGKVKEAADASSAAMAIQSGPYAF